MGEVVAFPDRGQDRRLVVIDGMIYDRRLDAWFTVAEFARVMSGVLDALDQAASILEDAEARREVAVDRRVPWWRRGPWWRKGLDG